MGDMHSRFSPATDRIAQTDLKLALILVQTCRIGTTAGESWDYTKYNIPTVADVHDMF